MPLSIIIVGVGDENFDKMNELDSDDESLSQDGRVAKRDIVQVCEQRLFLRGSPF